MSNPIFPLDLRPRLNTRHGQDFTTQRQDARVRTQNDAGPAKMRPRFTAAVEDWPGFCLGPMTGVQRSTLESFYVTTLVEGTGPFDWRDSTHAVATFRFVAPIAWFCVGPHHDPERQKWEAVLTVERLP